MESEHVEELFGQYILGELASRERRLLESHLESCSQCSARLEQEDEAVVRLALAVPRQEVPPTVKEALFSRVEADLRPGGLGRLIGGLGTLARGFTRPVQAHALGAVATVLVVVLVSGGVWFNDRVQDVAKENEEMSEKIETVVESEAQVRKMVNDQRYLTSMTAAPGVSVNMLRGSGNTDRAWGMVACCAVSDSGTIALLAVLNLPPLPPHQEYQVWLVQGRRKYPAGLFTVDSTGYAQTVIIPVVPFAEVDGIGITIEPVGGSEGPTGTNVLNGDL